MPDIQIASNLVLPAGETATQTLGAVAAKGGGKSYLAGKVVEGLYDAGAPFCVLDPVGNWSALTLGADGKSAGLAVPVIGGDRGDVPLNEDAAAVVGTLLVDREVSVVLDISELSKSRRKQYVADLCEAMYRAARRKRVPYMVVFEEAQLFAPQHTQRGEERMLGAVTDIVRLGRNYGLGSMLVTQRPQSVSKEVLNQVECLFVGSLRGPHERKAISGWIAEQGQNADLYEDLKQLPQLQPGEFFCWSPSWLRTFCKVKVLPKKTFDGSSTPTLGSSRAPSAKSDRGIADVIMVLRNAGAVTVGSQEDVNHVELGQSQAEVTRLNQQVKRLTGRIDELEAEVARLDGARFELTDALDGVLSSLAHVNAPLERGLAVLRSSQVKAPAGANGKASGDWCDVSGHFGSVPAVDMNDPVQRQFKEVRNSMYGKQAIRDVDGEVVPPEVRAEHRARRQTSRASSSTAERPEGLDKAEATVLAVLSWQTEPVSHSRLALLSGYPVRVSTLGNALSRLRVKGFITGSSGAISITPEGSKARGKVERPPQGKALFDWWLQHPKVTAMMGLMLRELRDAGKPISRGELGRRVDKEPTISTFRNALSGLRTLGLVTGRGNQYVGLAPELGGRA